MKVKVGDIIRNFERLREKVSLFGEFAGRFLINNQNAFELGTSVRTGNFWRAEISEQGNLETIGKSVIAVISADVYAKSSPLDIPDRFLSDWIVCAFDCVSSTRCISAMDSFEKGDFLKLKVRNIINNRQIAFRNIRSLPRRNMLEIAHILLDFDVHYKIGSRGESYMKTCGSIFQHGFVIDSDPEKITVREFWNSTKDAEGKAKVVSVMTEEEFTGRRKVFSFGSS